MKNFFTDHLFIAEDSLDHWSTITNPHYIIQKPGVVAIPLADLESKLLADMVYELNSYLRMMDTSTTPEPELVSYIREQDKAYGRHLPRF
jgi:hypothetical protein